MKLYVCDSCCVANTIADRPQVATLLIADTCNSAFNMAWIYNVLVNQFGASEFPLYETVELTVAIGNLDALSKADWCECYTWFNAVTS